MKVANRRRRVTSFFCMSASYLAFNLDGVCPLPHESGALRHRARDISKWLFPLPGGPRKRASSHFPIHHQGSQLVLYLENLCHACVYCMLGKGPRAEDPSSFEKTLNIFDCSHRCGWLEAANEMAGAWIVWQGSALTQPCSISHSAGLPSHGNNGLKVTHVAGWL